jgi:dipeptidyl aminopeptidase/acylaminoacyl peptidase
MSDFETLLAEQMKAHVADVPDALALPARVREAARQRRARKRMGVAAGALACLGIALAYTVPKVDSTHPGQAAAFLTGDTKLTPPAPLPAAELASTASSTVIPASGTPSGLLLAASGQKFLVLAPDGTTVERTVEVSGLATGDTMQEAQFSPDGQWIYFVRNLGCQGSNAALGIAKVPATGGALQAVTLDNDFGFSISPDGKQIAVARQSTGCSATSIVMHDLTTGVEKTSELTSGAIRSVAWMPDSKHLLVGATVGNGQPRLLDFDTSTGATLDSASAIVNGTLVAARIVNAQMHAIVYAGGRLVDVDPSTPSVRGVLGTLGHVPQTAMLDPSATRLITEAPTDTSALSVRLWANGAGTTFAARIVPLDWSR